MLVLTPRETLYPQIKHFFYQKGIITQVVTFQLAKKFGLSHASNVLRQMQVKLGGNLFYMMFNKEFDTKSTMVVGIDVEHSGQ